MSDGGPSFQRRLVLLVVAIVGASVVACSLAVYAGFARRVWRDFDARLAQDAHLVSLMVEEYGGGVWEVEPGGLEAFERGRGPAHVQVWTHDGATLARTPGGADLPRPAASASPVFSDVTLRDGRPGRLCQAWLPPRPGHRGAVQETPSGRAIAIAVARDVAEPAAAIARFRALLWAPAVVVIALAALAAWLSVRGMLRHVKRISEDIAALDASFPGGRLPLHAIPSELRRPFVKLNELLARIEASRARERQFNADVSHELRTPLAGMRALLEVSASRGRTAAEYEATIREALAIVLQTETIVENLLTLARLGSDRVSVEREEIALAPLVDDCFRPYGDVARRRRVRFQNRVPSDLVVWSDRHKLQLVLSNLLSNAVDYTAEGGWAAVESHPERGVLLDVVDSGPPIPREAMGKMFDPFFRMDGSRSGAGEHCGIGLALVRALCEALGYEVDVRNEAGGTVAFRVSADSTSLGFRSSRRAG